MAERRTQAQTVRGIGFDARLVEVLESLQRDVAEVRGRLDAADGVVDSGMTGIWSPNATATMFSGAGTYQAPTISGARYMGTGGLSWFLVPLMADVGVRRNARIVDVAVVATGAAANAQAAEVIAQVHVVQRFAAIASTPPRREPSSALMIGLAVIPSSGVSAIRIASVAWRID